MSGLLQASVIALALGFHFRNTPSSQPTSWWAYALFVYALLAVVIPWMSGGVTRNELNVLFSFVLGVVFALPMWAASRWLADSPYQLVATVMRILVWLWLAHLSLSVVLWMYDRTRGKPQPSG
jgi:Zn-dependent protease with chaperone function